MAMVRRGVMLSLREASCCKVEVVNGSDGERCLSVRLMFVTVKDLSPMSAIMPSTCSPEAGSTFLPSLP